jgi:hypothetical protein
MYESDLAVSQLIFSKRCFGFRLIKSDCINSTRWILYKKYDFSTIVEVKKRKVVSVLN